MNKILDVYLNQTLVGNFIQDIHGKNSFTYSRDYLQMPQAMAISTSLPLQEKPFDNNATHAFFAGLLPEESQRKIIARILGISANNDFSLLEKIGGECAGALTFLPPNVKINQQQHSYTLLTSEAIHEIINLLPQRPLLVGENGIRLSLAGVQDKLAVAQFDNQYYLPINDAPSSHILKPEIPGYEFSTVLNEAYCMKLAKAIGLNVADCTIGVVAATKFLLVERYDRILHAKMSLQRLHQEDFCQALAIPPEKKYQNEGGPSFKNCFTLIRNVSNNTLMDVQMLLNGIIFNFIIGNCDAHGKNFSLLYENDKIFLAPFYDLLSTLIYPELSRKMAMKLGTEYSIDKINTESFLKMADEAGLNKRLTVKRVIEVCDLVLKNLEHTGLDFHELAKLQELIHKRAVEIKLDFGS